MSKIRLNLKEAELVDIAVKDENCTLTKTGGLASYTSLHTGRSPNGKVIVFDDVTTNSIDWTNNTALSLTEYRNMLRKFEVFRDNLNCFCQNVTAVRDSRYALNVKIYTQFAKHSLFTRNMFMPSEDSNFEADWEVLHFPTITQHPFVCISFEDRKILISGTFYSGEIKKSVFTVLNFTLPENHDVLPMHCSVNVDMKRNNPAIFFGLSGTGKTTLSSDTNRILIGDDEHGWTPHGLTNFEGGCYAKTIGLSEKDEPQIWGACKKPNVIFENVVVKNGIPDFDDDKHTQNGRVSYPTNYIDNADEAGFVDKHPKNVIMLTCDSFGILPPVCKLSSEEAHDQFLIGYTSKVAGTEAGVNTPVPTFSACFGLPFMPLSPKTYAKMLKTYVQEHDVNCWLVNTGWTGGPYGTGERISISVTRKIITAILDGSMAKSNCVKHTFTGFQIPNHTGISDRVLFPELSWKDKEDYSAKAAGLIIEFRKQLSKLGV